MTEPSFVSVGRDEFWGSSSRWRNFRASINIRRLVTRSISDCWVGGIIDTFVSRTVFRAILYF